MRLGHFSEIVMLQLILQPNHKFKSGPSLVQGVRMSTLSDRAALSYRSLMLVTTVAIILATLTLRGSMLDAIRVLVAIAVIVFAWITVALRMLSLQRGIVLAIGIAMVTAALMR